MLLQEVESAAAAREAEDFLGTATATRRIVLTASINRRHPSAMVRAIGGVQHVYTR